MAHPIRAWHVALVAALFAAALVALLPSASAAPQAPSPPTCQVTLDQRVVTAAPTRTSAVTLTFTGAIDVSLGSISGSRVLSIVGSITPDVWAVSVSPSSENVTGTQKVFINASLTVPPATLASTHGTLTIRASFQAVPGANSTTVTCSDQSSVSVAAYYGLDTDALTPRVTLVAGKEGVQATVIIHNLGNAPDTFIVELENKLDVDPLGILTNLPRQILIQPEAETNVTFTINATPLANANTYELFVLVRSQAQPQSARDVTTVIAVVTRADILPTDDPTALLIGVAAIAGVVGALAGLRYRRRRKAAREARRQLAKIVRARKEEAAGAAPFEEAQEPAAAGPPMRVRVKVPPKPLQ